ncbi:MAG: nucleoside-diphosphate kinase [Actinomycetota bacterium]
MAEESTLLIIKPDALRRGLAGTIISRVERKELRIEAMKTIRIDRALAEQHYAEHTEKPFFDELVGFITSADVIVAKVTGREAISVLRGLMGATDPAKAAQGTIRGDLGLQITENLVHGSDSPESAKRELALFFPD